ncbi:hypothetical protein VP1G_08194 [Cytospora mali]|uniref:Uncharacterized protein n=1 Tax=Cytospora mali TaxID=578113 RepID=A0A194VB42_CYTMA|nr:hypothetical protein VP1G_08194 [Valsa mali var. pyri (nom. inval.)]
MAVYEMDPLPERMFMHAVIDDKRTDRTKSWVKNIILSLSLGAFAIGMVCLAVLYVAGTNPAMLPKLTQLSRNQDMSRRSWGHRHCDTGAEDSFDSFNSIQNHDLDSADYKRRDHYNSQYYYGVQYYHDHSLRGVRE